MRQSDDCSDDRNQCLCIHCGESLEEEDMSREHAPTRGLLDRPLPDNLPVVHACQRCNSGFSDDEAYLVALIACVLTGSTELDRDRFPVAAGILDHSAELKARIERMRRVQLTLWGNPEVEWTAELDRVANVVVKNARCHAFHELGEPLRFAPSYAGFSPLCLMSGDWRDGFEQTVAGSALWPEVGSRMMQRVVMGDLDRGWVTVKEGVYRYMVFQQPGETLVRSVIREYLATEVSWSDEADDLAS